MPPEQLAAGLDRAVAIEVDPHALAREVANVIAEVLAAKRRPDRAHDLAEPRVPAAQLEAIADLAMERKVGARGLRMILEDLMLDLMYYLPSYPPVRDFPVTPALVLAQKISLTILEKAG